ncbi:MAG: 7-carboxy-7-deazaguanine synthase QueE [Gammaproteobacteria bacterium]|nr:7-carboxy-7-deazaguanine synthase QueE [Gammaproteobacteria bacterium]MDE2252644.1 7-carboxy-7-deazaguanine synthase QueE [Gammaproteobacteria bacterium]
MKITEIFHSLQGEAQYVGMPTVFVRLTGCPLRCHYCDTAYAFHGGEWWTLGEILERVAEFGARDVCVTGGEPLAQRACVQLLHELCERGYRVSLETSGALIVAGIDARVSRVVDVKTPGSGEEPRNLYPQLQTLNPLDQIKFVITSRSDYEWSRALLAEQALDQRCGVLFSPSFGQVEPRELAEWILADRLPVRFQLQLHKLLWGDERGR